MYYIMIKRRLSMFLMIIIAVFMFAGCATAPKAVDLKESLRATATEYWKLRMANKYDESYKMEDREGLPPLTEYMGKAMTIKRLNIVTHSIKDINVEGDKGMVDVEFGFIMPPVTKHFNQLIKDEWIYRDGEWLHRMPK